LESDFFEQANLQVWVWNNMIELYENMSADRADLCALILRASGIPFRLRKQGNGYGIWVQQRDYQRASYAVEAYFQENRPENISRETVFKGLDHGQAGLWAAGAIAVVYAAVARVENVHEVWNDFGAAAWKILDGELYRVVTALMLHADSVHLLGNMAGLAIFATAVCHFAGWGAGMLMVLLSGALGNLVNAVLHESGHMSIGASTSVFGAIGILSGYQFLRRKNSRRQKAAAWLPLACGLALLGFLGSGAHVDLAAHLFGFLVGIFIGIGYAGSNIAIGSLGQKICLAVCLAIILSSWASGVLRHLI
jgi:membrane associated rhomboid family serine protease